MPLGHDHRRNMRSQQIAVNAMLDSVCVARPVGKAEIAQTLFANEALKKEWDRLL